jgi:predicted Zn finger-like uncharacterized protein
MIIECGNCGTKFRLDESVIKKEGSKVRCSLCSDVFVAYPPDEPLPDDLEIAPAEAEGGDSTAEEENLSLFPEGVDKVDEEEDLDLSGIFEESGEEDEPGEVQEEELREVLVEKEAEPTDDLVDHEPEELVGDDTAIPEASAEDESPETIVSPEEAVPKRKGKSRTLIIVLLLFLGLVGAAIAVLFLAPEVVPENLRPFESDLKDTGADTGIRRLAFEAVTGGFVHSESAGKLFVIRGKVRNQYPNPRSHILVRGSLLDEKGEVVRSGLAYAGNSFEPEQMKNLSMEDIEHAMENRAGKDGANENVAPDATVPFVIVFSELPENLSEFTVEAMSSSEYM